MAVEPLVGEPAAVADLPGERALVLSDYHAGLEAGLRHEGVELASRADQRREHVLDLLDRSGADRLVILGDLGHGIGEPGGEERTEIEQLLSIVTERVPVTIAKGNHDGDLEPIVDEIETGRAVEITPGHGRRYGDVGFVHGHTWPAPDVLGAAVVCVGHEHPMVRLEDEVGGSRAERAWLRGSLVSDPFESFHDRELDMEGELVVFPSCNDLTGGTWVNVEGQQFLSPFLPAGLAGGQAYLLDGTRLGEHRRV